MMASYRSTFPARVSLGFLTVICLVSISIVFPLLAFAAVVVTDFDDSTFPWSV